MLKKSTIRGTDRLPSLKGSSRNKVTSKVSEVYVYGRVTDRTVSYHLVHLFVS